MKKIFLLLTACLVLSLGFSFESHADNVVIVIDPGHGGDNEGAKKGEDIVEKEINLKVAKAMKEHLSLYEGVDVYLTHDTDESLSLKKRAKRAKDKGADYVISLHFNASEYQQLYGTECWVPFDNFYEECYEFAAYFSDELTGAGLFNRGIKTRVNDDGDNYYGIIRENEKLDIPCVLVEHCHLDNENDEGYYETDEALENFGILDAEAVAKYLGLKSERLGNDYSDYSLEIIVPRSENTRDKTGPDTCALTVKEYDSTTGDISLILTATENDSRLLYYDYSYDGGVTFTKRIPFEKESVEISFTMEEGTIPNLIARAYNLNDVFTESNTIILEKVEYPIEEIPVINPIETDTTQNIQAQKWLVFFVIVAAILVLCFMVMFGLYFSKVLSRKKRLKRKRLEEKRRPR